MSSTDGDGGTLAAYHLSEDMVGKNWADVMQEDQMSMMSTRASSIAEERDSPPPVSSRVPPFVVIVDGIPNGASEEEIFYFFGGEGSVTDMKLNGARASIEFSDETSLEKAIKKNGELLMEQPLKVTEEVRKASNDVRSTRGGFAARPPRPPLSPRGGHHGGPHGYQRNDSREYFHHQNRNDYHGGRHDHYQQQTFRDGFGGRGGYGGGGRGGHGRRDPYDDRHSHGYDNRRGSNHGGYGGTVQRSGSYANHDDYNRPGGVSRSRNESTSSSQAEPRRVGSYGSRQSEPAQPTPAPVVRKPVVNPFGGAKPVDTATRLNEIEAKQLAEDHAKKEMDEKKRREREEADKREKEEYENREKEKAAAAPPVPVQILRRPQKAEEPSLPSTPAASNRSYESVVESTPPTDPAPKAQQAATHRKEFHREDSTGRGGVQNFRGTTRVFVNRGGLQKSATTDFDGNRGERMERGRRGRGHRGGGFRGRGGHGEGQRRGSLAASERNEETRSEEKGSRDEKRDADSKYKKKEKAEERRSLPPTSNVESSSKKIEDSQAAPPPAPIPASLPTPPTGGRDSPSTPPTPGEGKKKNKKKGGGGGAPTADSPPVPVAAAEKKKPPTPRKKKNGPEKSKFASDNRFGALLDEQ